MLANIAFLTFAFFMVLSCLLVITARNPVHAVMFLVLAFFNAAGLFVMMGAEFLGLILAIVYVGAVAVLFLFVVMMLDIDFAALRAGVMRALPVGLALGVVLIAQFFLMFQALPPAVVPTLTDGAGNTESLGAILYTIHVAPFQVAGMVLFVAMVGAIVLTHHQKKSGRAQRVARQVGADPAQIVTLTQPKVGKGVDA